MHQTPKCSSQKNQSGWKSISWVYECEICDKIDQKKVNLRNLKVNLKQCVLALSYGKIVRLYSRVALPEIMCWDNWETNTQVEGTFHRSQFNLYQVWKTLGTLVSKCVPSPGKESTRTLIKIEIFWPFPDLQTRNLWQLYPEIWILKIYTQWVFCSLKSENYWNNPLQKCLPAC